MATKIKITPEQRTIIQLESRVADVVQLIADQDLELAAARQLIEKQAKEVESAKNNLKYAQDGRDEANKIIAQIDGFLDAVPDGPPRAVPSAGGYGGETKIDTSTRLMVYLSKKAG